MSLRLAGGSFSPQVERGDAVTDRVGVSSQVVPNCWYLVIASVTRSGMVDLTIQPVVAGYGVPDSASATVKSVAWKASSRLNIAGSDSSVRVAWPRATGSAGLPIF